MLRGQRAAELAHVIEGVALCDEQHGLLEGGGQDSPVQRSGLCLLRREPFWRLLGFAGEYSTRVEALRVLAPRSRSVTKTSAA